MSAREAFVVTLSAGIVVTTAVHWLCETAVVRYISNDERFALTPKQLHDVALKLARYLYFSVQGLPIIAYLLYTLATSGFGPNAYLWANAALYAVAFDVYELGQIRGDPSAAAAGATSGARGSSDFLRIFHHIFELCIVLAMSVGGEVSPFLIFAGCQVVLGNNAFIFPVLVRVRPCTQKRQVYYTVASAVIAMVPVVFCSGGIIVLLAIGVSNGSLSVLRSVTGGLFVAVFVTLDTVLFFKYFLPLIKKARSGELISPPPKFTTRLRSADSTLLPGLDPMVVSSRPQSPSVVANEATISVGGDTTTHRRSFFGDEDTNSTESERSSSPADEDKVTDLPVPSPHKPELAEEPQRQQPQPQLANSRPPLTKYNSGPLFGLPSNDTTADLTFVDDGDDTVVFSDTDDDYDDDDDDQGGDTTLMSTTRLSSRQVSGGHDDGAATAELDSTHVRTDSAELRITSEAELMLERGTANNSAASSPHLSHRQSRSSLDSLKGMSTQKVFPSVDSLEDMSTEKFFDKMKDTANTNRRDMMQLTLQATTTRSSSPSHTDSPRSVATHSRSRSNFSLDLERDCTHRSTSSRSISFRDRIEMQERQFSHRGSHMRRKPLIAAPGEVTTVSRDDATDFVAAAPPAAPLVVCDADADAEDKLDDREVTVSPEFVVSV